MTRRNQLIAGMLSVAAAFVIVITLGYEIHERYPAIPDLVSAPIAVLTLVGISFGAVRLIILRTDGHPRRARVDRAVMRRSREESARATAAFNERKRLRIAELLADPAKSKYAALVERGQEWSDAQIAYHEDQNATATCPHLQPIEHAMRLDGVVPKLRTPWLRNSGPMVTADCRINYPELTRRFALPETVRFTEDYQPERSAEDNPWAELRCTQCNSVIELVHSEWPTATTKWFPST